jgi:hypothetical protein
LRFWRLFVSIHARSVGLWSLCHVIVFVHLDGFCYICWTFINRSHIIRDSHVIRECMHALSLESLFVWVLLFIAKQLFANGSRNTFMLYYILKKTIIKLVLLCVGRTARIIVPSTLWTNIINLLVWSTIILASSRHHCISILGDKNETSFSMTEHL